MMQRTYKNFPDFYAYYLTCHSHPACLALHFLGTSLFLSSLVVSLLTGYWLLIPLAGALGYGMAWAGHFVFEGNKPTSFKYLGWSGKAGRRMYFEILTGRLKIFKKKSGYP